jgi:hypothetical protein
MSGDHGGTPPSVSAHAVSPWLGGGSASGEQLVVQTGM